MIPSTVLTIGLALGALGAISPKNFILIIPDGFAPASQTLARTYVSLDEGGSPQSLSIKPLPVDMTVSTKEETQHNYQVTLLFLKLILTNEFCF